MSDLANVDEDVLAARTAGVLLHPTSLPQAMLGGCLDATGRQFIDFLAAAGIGVWQVLPLGLTHDDGSPYLSLSVHAGNPALIELQPLHEMGLAERLDGASGPAAQTRDSVISSARQRMQNGDTPELLPEVDAFEHRSAAWLDDFCLFRALREEHRNLPWWEWPESERDRQASALTSARRRLSERIADYRFEQYLFDRQWLALRAFANERGVRLFGDVPIFVAQDSADVWANRALFLLDSNGLPNFVAGVPPDYFSATGQRWGNPLYDWERLEATGYEWWIQRLATEQSRFDLIRIDHFRGFESYWRIPAAEETAIQGEWCAGPGAKLFDRLRVRLGHLPIVAEDLGIITEEVRALRESLRIPGMKVLHFAFGGDSDNPYLPHNHVNDCVVYTGTHDNDTTLGWYQSLDDGARALVHRYLGIDGSDAVWQMVASAMASVARLSIVPLQDFLELGSDCRMNTPGVAEGNWRWRFEWDDIPPGLADRIAGLVDLYGRR